MQIAIALVTLACAAAQAAGPSPAASRLYAVVVRTGPSWDPAKPAASQVHFKEHSANIRRLGAEGKWRSFAAGCVEAPPSSTPAPHASPGLP